jgi:hypothetical protein
MAGRPLILVCDLAGTNPESRKLGFRFDTFAEVQAGETIAAAVVEWQAEPAGAVASVATTAGAPVSAAGITVGVPAVVGSQVQAQFTASAAAVGITYAVCCSATLSTSPDAIVVRGRLSGEAST